MVPVTLHAPHLIQPASGDPDLFYSGQEMRNLWAGLLKFPGSKGVCGPAAYQVTQRQAGANFSVDIAPGYSFMPGGDITNQGTYGLWMDASYNLATPSPPSTGQNNHRVVLQVRDKSANATWTTYDFIPLLLADTGSGTPAVPNSALNLAIVTINAGDASVTNASISDRRTRIDDPLVYKAANTALGTGTSFTSDPDLQLMGLASGGVYEIRGLVMYDAGSVSLYKHQFSVPAGASFPYLCSHTTNANTFFQFVTTGTSSVNSYANGTGTEFAIAIQGTIVMGTTVSPLIWQFANQATGGAGPQNYAGSYLAATRIA